jgi:hypothetical protein
MGFMDTSGLQVLMKDLTLPASRNLFPPAFLHFPPAERSIDEPTKMAHPEFPRRAGLPGPQGTAADFPAGEQPLHSLPLDSLYRIVIMREILFPSLVSAAEPFPKLVKK